MFFVKWDEIIINYALYRYHKLFLLENLFLYMSLQNNNCLIWLERQWLAHSELAGWKAFIRYFIRYENPKNLLVWHFISVRVFEKPKCSWLWVKSSKRPFEIINEFKYSTLIRIVTVYFHELFLKTLVTFCVATKSIFAVF